MVDYQKKSTGYSTFQRGGGRGRGQGTQNVKINHLDRQKLRNLIHQLAISSQVQVQRFDDNMFNNSNRRQERYPCNTYHPNRGGNWNRRSESTGRFYSNPQNDLTSSEYTVNYDGENYEPSAGENWTYEYVEAKTRKIPNNVKFRSHRYNKRGTYRNSNANPRNNYSHDGYYQKPYKKYEENNQFGYRKYPYRRETPDSNELRTYGSSNFKNESCFYNKYDLQNWDDDHETVDMDISDSECVNKSGSQKRKFERYDEDIPIKKTCSESTSKTHSQILRLRHSDSSDVTDDDIVGVNRKDFGRNFCPTKNSLDSPLRRGADPYVKRGPINAETSVKQLPLSTKTTCDNLSKQIASASTSEKACVKTVNLKKTGPKNGETQELATKENTPSSEDLNRIKNKSASFPKHHKPENEKLVSSLPAKNVGDKSANLIVNKDPPKTPLKKSDFVGSGKSNIVRKPQENFKQPKDAAKIPDDAQKKSKSVNEEAKKVEKLGPPTNTQAQSTKSQSKAKKLNGASEKTTKRERAVSVEELTSKNQQEHGKEKKLNSGGDSKKEATSVRKERAFSLDGLQVPADRKEEQKTVSKNKKLKTGNASQIIPKKVAETKSTGSNQDLFTVVEKQTHTVVSDKVSDVNKSMSSLSKHPEGGKVVRNKEVQLSSAANTQAPSVARKIKRSASENINLKPNKLVKKVNSTGATSKTVGNEQPTKKPKKTSTDCGSKAKEESKFGAPSKNNSADSKSVSNQMSVGNESSKVCEKKLKELTAKLNELVQKMSDAQAPKEQSEIKEAKSAAAIGMVESVAKPAKKIVRRRGKSCDSRSFNQESYLEVFNLRPATARSKSVDPSQFNCMPFRITRSKSALFGLFPELPPSMRRRSRSRSSSVPKLSEQEISDSQNKNNNGERVLKASDEVKQYKPLLIDMEHRKSVTDYSPRDDDDEVAMHMANYTDGSCVIQQRAVDPRDPRKNQLAKKTSTKHRKELIRLKDFVREQYQKDFNPRDEEQQTRDIQDILRQTKPVEQTRKVYVNENNSNRYNNPKGKVPKQRDPTPKGSASKSESKKCAPQGQKRKPDMPKLDDACPPQISRVNVGLEEIEGYFPSEGENKNCIRLNVSNGKQERAITILKADVLQIKFPAEETTKFIPEPIVNRRAQISNVSDPLHEALGVVTVIQEVKKNEEVIDLTLDDSCEEQSDLTSINSINKLTEQLLEMYGDDVKSSILKSESSISPNRLLNILESPVQRDTTDGSNDAAPYTIIITPLLPNQSGERAESITIELPDVSITETARINPDNAAEVVSTETTQAQKNVESLNNSKETSPQRRLPDLISMIPGISIVPLGDASKQNENALPGLTTRGASELPKSALSNQTRPDGLPPPANVESSVLPNAVGVSPGSSGVLPSQSANPSSTTVATLPSTSSGEQQNSHIEQMQHMAENLNRRSSRDNSASVQNRLGPYCSRAYRFFLSANVFFVLRYQCIMDLAHHSLPSFIRGLGEIPGNTFAVSVTQNFFQHVLTGTEKDIRQYYNNVKLGNVKFSVFLVDLDRELGRSGQKLFWKWNLEFLYRLLCRNVNCRLSLNACYEKFTSDLKMYYETYVSRYKRTPESSRNAQNTLTERASRPTNISVVPLATLQDPALCSSNLPANNSNVQRPDLQQQIQSIQKNNNTSIQPLPPTHNQIVPNQTWGMTSQQLRILMQQIEKCKKLGLLSRQQSTSSCYTGGNMSGVSSAHRRPSQESVVSQRVTNQLEHGRQQLNLHRLLTEPANRNDYSQNLHNMISARISNADSGTVRGQPPPLQFPSHSTVPYQHSNPARAAMNDQRAQIPLNPFISPQHQQQQQQRRPDNATSNSVFNRMMTDMAKTNSQPQACRPRTTERQQSVQHLSMHELNIDIVTVQQLTGNTPVVTNAQRSSNSINLQQTTLHTSTVTNNEPATQNERDHTPSITSSESVTVMQNAEQHQTSETNTLVTPIVTPKEEDNAQVEVVAHEPRNGDEFVDFENYLSNAHGENWDDDIQMIWPENYVVQPIAEGVKDEDGVQAEDEDPIPRSMSNDSGIESPSDIVLPSQVQLPGSLYEGRFCFCGKPAVYVCTCKLQMYCSEVCQMSDWQRHGAVHGHR